MWYINPNYHWKNEVKQTKATPEKLLKRGVLFPITKVKDPSKTAKTHQIFEKIFTTIFHHIAEWILFVV